MFHWVCIVCFLCHWEACGFVFLHIYELSCAFGSWPKLAQMIEPRICIPMASAGSFGQPPVDLRASHREVAMIGYCNHLLSRALERLEAVEVSIEMNSAEGLDPQSGLLTDCKQDLRRVITELEMHKETKNEPLRLKSSF